MTYLAGLVRAKPWCQKRWIRLPDHAAALADLDPELHSLPLIMPVGILGNGGWETAPLALSCSEARSVEEYAPREAR